MHEQLLDKNGNYMALDITIEDKLVYMPFEMKFLKERQDCFFSIKLQSYKCSANASKNIQDNF